MRRLAALLLLAVAVPLLAEPPAPSARQKDLIEQLLTLSHVDETVRLIVDSMLEQLGPTLDETRTAEGKQAIDRYRELVREKIDYKQFVRDVYGPLYAKYFTEEKLADLAVFSKSRTGRGRGRRSSSSACRGNRRWPTCAASPSPRKRGRSTTTTTTRRRRRGRSWGRSSCRRTSGSYRRRTAGATSSPGSCRRTGSTTAS